MILQYYEGNKEWAYTQADIISSRRFDWSGPLREHIKSESIDTNAKEVLIDGEIHWLHADDISKVIHKQNVLLEKEIKYGEWYSDDGNSYLCPEIAIVTLKNFNKAPIYMTISRSAYLLNDNGKTISSILG